MGIADRLLDAGSDRAVGVTLLLAYLAITLGLWAAVTILSVDTSADVAGVPLPLVSLSLVLGLPLPLSLLNWVRTGNPYVSLLLGFGPPIEFVVQGFLMTAFEIGAGSGAVLWGFVVVYAAGGLLASTVGYGLGAGLSLAVRTATD